MARQMEVQYINFYTAGSEAVKFDPTPARPKTQSKLPKPRRKKRILVYVDPVALMGICVAVVLLITMAVGLIRLNAAQAEAEVMQNYVQTLQTKNEQLKETYTSGYDLEEIRQIALTRGMIPIEDAKHVTITVTVPEPEEEPNAWESFCTFLAGLFA